MIGSANLNIGNSVHLHRRSLAGSGGACLGAAKMLQSELLSPVQRRRRRSSADMTTPISWRTSSRRGAVATCP